MNYHIHAVATKSRPVPKLILDRIRPWVNTRFFAATPPECSTPLLYAPTSFQIMKADSECDDLSDPTRTLVVPAGASVRVTDSERQPAITDAASHPKFGHWMQHDLRRDLLYLVHNNNDHPSLAHTLRTLRDMCWFPQIVQYTKYHVGACPMCIPKMRAQRAIGSSVVAAHRLWVVYIDHFVLEGDLPSRTTSSHILSIMCSRTRFTMFVVVPSDAAKDTAMAIHNRWYPFLGVPVLFKSDRGPGFASKCMSAFRTMIGVKKWIFSAADDPTHHSLLEHKHKLLKDVISVADAKGDIKSKADLEYYVASANGRQNLHTASGDTFSPFECLTGQPPRIICSLASSAPIPEVSSPIDKLFLATLRDRIDDEFVWASQQRDEIVRQNVMRRDFTERASNSTPTNFSAGDTASLHGSRVRVLELLAVTPSGPTKARVQYSSGKVDTVNFHALRPMADPTSELMKPREIPLEVGTFVFFDAADTFVHGGIITATNKSSGFVSVHDCLGNESRTRQYTPLYSYPSKPQHVPHAKPPRDSAAAPVILEVAIDNIIVAGSISASFHIDEQLLAYISSLGTTMMPLLIDTPRDPDTWRTHEVELYNMVQYMNPIMMPLMVDDSSAIRSEEASTLRGLLHAACLSPFGSLPALRTRAASQILGISPDEYAYDRISFQSLTRQLRAGSTPRSATIPRCVHLMANRNTAGSRDPSVPPPQYSVEDPASPSSAEFRSYDLSNAFNTVRPLGYDEDYVRCLVPGNTSASPVGSTYVPSPLCVLCFAIIALMAAFITQFILNMQAVTLNYRGPNYDNAGG